MMPFGRKNNCCQLLILTTFLGVAFVAVVEPTERGGNSLKSLFSFSKAKTSFKNKDAAAPSVSLNPNLKQKRNQVKGLKAQQQLASQGQPVVTASRGKQKQAVGQGRNAARKLVVVAGPTGCGKSDLGVEVALAFNGEVISADSMQIYKGLYIASNTITVPERKGVPHHLLDFLEPNYIGYTDVDFARDSWAVIDNLWAQGKLPVIAGGSESYINAVLFGKRKAKPEDVLVIYLDPAKDEAVHGRRLDERVDKFVKMGLLEENQKFFDEVYTNNWLIDGFNGMVQSIGFREFMVYLRLTNAEKNTAEGKKMLAEALQMAKLDNRHYARMQKIRFQRRFLPKIQKKHSIYVSDKRHFESHVVRMGIRFVKDFLQ